MRETDQEFAARALRHRVDVFTQRLLDLASAVSDKNVHDTRVESRRLRAALDAFQNYFPPHPLRIAYKDIHLLTRLLGKPRETAVSLELLGDLATNGQAAPSFLKHLKRRLKAKLKKQVACLEKKIGRLDPLRVRSRLDFLLSVMERDALAAAGALQRSAPLPYQPTLFPMSESALSQAARIVNAAIARICRYRAAKQFAVATDEELHSLRIVSKKARYAMELFAPIWPGGLAVPIDRARKFQDAAGSYQDWRMLRVLLDKEVQRLNLAHSAPLDPEIAQMFETAALRSESMKEAMRAALLNFQDSLADLRRAANVLMSNPKLSAMKRASFRLRTVASPRRLKAARSHRTGRISAQA